MPTALPALRLSTPGRHGRNRLNAALAAALLAGAGAAHADAGAPVQALSFGVGFESVRLPDHERLGLASAHVLFGIGNGLWLGPVTYGAATGQRGGFFVLGAELQKRWALSPSVELRAGLSLGGGGGSAAPVGNGLMVRPAIALLHQIGPLRAGVSLSSVRFPGTPINSNQLGLVVEWSGEFTPLPLDRLGQRMAASTRSGLGFDRIGLTVLHYSLAGTTQRLGFGLTGARLEQQLDANGNLWGLEAAAGTQSKVAGYMELLAFAGHELSLGDRWRIGARAGVGLGGGGGVPAGGGAIYRVEGSLSAAITDTLRVGATVGHVGGRSSAMSGRSTGLWLSTELEPAGLPGSPGRAGTVQRFEWGGMLQQFVDVTRHDGSRRSLQTMGLVVNRWLDANLYLSGQAHSAFGGGAGAYSMGLVGAGLATPAQQGRWQLAGELLAGGAGGGGVEGVKGAVGQLRLWAAPPLASLPGQLRFGLGAATSSHQGRATPVASLAWNTSWGQVAP